MAMLHDRRAHAPAARPPARRALIACMQHLAHYFVKRLVSLALDRKDREREAASALLSGLYAEVLSGATMDKGFMSLVEALDDTVLDVPDAPRLLATFMARAVVDDVLPPAIVSKLPEVGRRRTGSGRGRL